MSTLFTEINAVEFLQFVLMTTAAWLVWKHPERERLALSLAVASIVLMVALFTLGTRSSLLPGVNF